MASLFPRAWVHLHPQSKTGEEKVEKAHLLLNGLVSKGTYVLLELVTWHHLHPKKAGKCSPWLISQFPETGTGPLGKGSMDFSRQLSLQTLELKLMNYSFSNEFSFSPPLSFPFFLSPWNRGGVKEWCVSDCLLFCVFLWGQPLLNSLVNQRLLQHGSEVCGVWSQVA